MLYLSDILDLNCLLGTFEAATFTNLNLNMTVAQLGLEPVGEGGLEEDIDELFDTALHLFVGEFEPLITSFIHGVVQGPIRGALNGLLGAVVPWAGTCPDHVDHEVNFIDFLESPVSQRRCHRACIY